MDKLPTVCVKYSFSTRSAPTLLSIGKMSRSLPNRLELLLAAMCWASIIWAWSWRVSIRCGSFRPRVSDLKRTMALRKANSAPSTFSCLNFWISSLMRRTLDLSDEKSLTFSRGLISIDSDHWRAQRINISDHDSSNRMILKINESIRLCVFVYFIAIKIQRSSCIIAVKNRNQNEINSIIKL